MIRCVAYYGDIRAIISRDELERIARRTRNRNAALGVTGCLFHFGGHFVQVLEGPPENVGRLYGTIVSDDRHPDVIGLSDHIVHARAYSSWSIRFVHGADLRPDAVRGALPAPRPAERPEVTDEAARVAVALLAAKLDRQIAGQLRIAPQQPRAMKTVDRLLDTAGAMIARESNFEHFTLEAVAALAGVTQQSAYRYFEDIDDLIRMTVRRMQAAWHARFLDFMLRQAFASEKEVASATVAFIAETYQTQIRARDRLKRELLRRFHDVEYDAAWLVSDAISRSIAGAGGASLRIDGAEMAAGLVALWAIAKALTLRDAAALGRLAVRVMMTDVFLAALRGPLRGDADGLASLA